MKQSEIDAVVNLRSEGLQYKEIAKRLKMSIDAVKRRYYARTDDHTIETPKAIYTPSQKTSAKVLFFDIETSPVRGWVWRAYEDNLLKTDKDWYMLSYAYKWANDDQVNVRALCDYPKYDKNKEDDSPLVSDLWKLFDEADIIIGHNGDAFDIKKANARFLQTGLKTPPSTYKTIDTLKIARRYFKFTSNRLNELGNYLNIGEKLPHTGMHLWFGCMTGDPESWELMKKYNKQDVVLLEKVYHYFRSWHTTHPNMTIYDHVDHGIACPRCESLHVQKRGYEYKAKTKYQRFQCTDCGSWFSHGRPIKKIDPLSLQDVS